MALFFLLMNAANVKGQDRGEISFQIFYSSLSPYGNWIDNPRYGKVWQPRVSRGFRPYRDRGHWVWSEMYEWIWVSDYEWGWAPFHYGRWELDSFYGWIWVPGYEWSPAWVSWRSGPDYYGWAPLSPDINIGFGFVYDSYYPPNDYWVFVPRHHMHSIHLPRHCYATNYNQGIVAHTQPIRTMTLGQFIMNAPTRKEVEKSTGTKIQPVKIGDAIHPGRSEIRKDEVKIFRPFIHKENLPKKPLEDKVSNPKPFQPRIENPKPQIENPKPFQPQVPKPKLQEVENPKPQIENPKPFQPQVPNPKPREVENPKPQIENPKPFQPQEPTHKPREVETPKPREVPTPKPREVENPKPREVENPKPQFKNPKPFQPQTPNNKQQTPNPKPQTPNNKTQTPNRIKPLSGN